MDRSLRSGSPSANTLAIAALLVSASSTLAQTAILREGDPIGALGTATTINNVNVNHAFGFAVGIGTSSGPAAFWGNATGGPGAVLRSADVFPPYTQGGIETFFGLSDAGVIAYSPTITAGAPVTNADSVWSGDTPVAIAGEPSSVAGLFWSFASRPTMTATGEPWFVGGTRTTVTGSTSNRGLFRGPAGTKVVIGGDFVAGIADAVSAAVGPAFTYRVSADGSNWISEIGFLGAAANSDAVVINNAVAESAGVPVREGFAVPVLAGGAGGELWQNFGKLGINNAGTWLMTGDTSAAANDDFLAINGLFVLRPGVSVGGFTLGGTIEAAYLNNNGDWVVNWTVDVGGTFREAIILNGSQVLIKETDLIDYDGDGLPDPGVTLVDFTGIDNLAIGDRRADGTADIYFTADTSLAINNEAVYRMTVDLDGPGAPCPLDLTNNGIVDADDIFAFLNIWFLGPPGMACSGPPSICDLADWNDDGTVTADDIFAYLNDWFAFGPGMACP